MNSEQFADTNSKCFRITFFCSVLPGIKSMDVKDHRLGVFHFQRNNLKISFLLIKMKSPFELHVHFSTSNEIKMKSLFPPPQCTAGRESEADILNIYHISSHGRCSLHTWTLLPFTTLLRPEPRKNALEI